eukprot:7432977-Pyramimonas_sp.AAC.1
MPPRLIGAYLNCLDESGLITTLAHEEMALVVGSEHFGVSPEMLAAADKVRHALHVHTCVCAST